VAHGWSIVTAAEAAGGLRILVLDLPWEARILRGHHLIRLFGIPRAARAASLCLVEGDRYDAGGVGQWGGSSGVAPVRSW
jgi:hypothetical protein